MKRITITPRVNWQQSIETIGFGFHTSDIPYWDESAFYSFDMAEISQIEKATAELWQLCLAAVEYIIDQKLYFHFDIPTFIIPEIERSWEEDHPSIYGRFDLCYKDGQIKMLEFNADTPTSLFEAGVIQWHWLQDINPALDQFNSIHEKLIAYWKHLKDYLHPDTLYFSCMKHSLEDLTTTEYIRDCAIQSGIDTRFIFIDEIGWDCARETFVDNENVGMKNIFKLYPWEIMISESFSKNISLDRNKSYWIEPAWKLLLSSKAILPLLWQLFPGHHLLLPSSFEILKSGSYAEKPIWSREGNNIKLVSQNQKILETDGAYGNSKTIFQSLCTLPDHDGHYAVIGSWIIGQQPAGIGIRESDSLITSNTSRFVPHLIEA